MMAVRHVGRIEVDLARAADIAVPLVIGAILRRVQSGISTSGTPFAPYSPAYAARLVDAGRLAAPVTLRQSGSMLGSVGERSRRMTEGVVVIHIGPGTEAGPAYSIGRGGLRRRGLRKISNARLGAIHQRRRKWLGVAKELRAIVAQMLTNRGVLRIAR